MAVERMAEEESAGRNEEPRVTAPPKLAKAATAGAAVHGAAETSGEAREPGEPVGPLTSPTSSSWTFTPFKPKAIGSNALAPPPLAPPPDEPPRAAGLASAVHDIDVKKGIATGAPVVSVARDIARHELLPVNTDAKFEVRIDSSGHVVSVRVVDCSSYCKDWEAVKDGIERAMRGRTLKVMVPGTTALLTFAMESRWQLPSGSDRLGGKPEIWQTEDGLPGVGTHFDLTDIGAKRMHMVYTHMIRETLE